MTYVDRRKLLLANQETMYPLFPLGTRLITLCCAGLYAIQNAEADADTLNRVNEMIDAAPMLGMDFYSLANAMQVTLLSLSGDAQGLLDRSSQLCDVLQDKCSCQRDRYMAALLLARQAGPARWRKLANRATALYQRVCKKHPFLTANGSCVLFTQLALSTLTDNELIGRIEWCYTRLSGYFSRLRGRNVLELCLVLAMLPGETNDKCSRVLALVRELKALGCDWRSGPELPMLGIVAESPRPAADLARLIADNYQFFRLELLFGGISGISKTEFLMYSSLVMMELADPAEMPEVNGINLTLLTQAVTALATTEWVSEAYSHG